MNERIRELAVQAGKYAWENETHWSADAERATLFEQKFAELIVRECLDILEDEDTHDVYGQPIRLATIRIKKHFGVEE